MNGVDIAGEEPGLPLIDSYPARDELDVP